MSILTTISKLLSKTCSRNSDTGIRTIPTVKFDKKLVTSAIKQKTLEDLKDFFGTNITTRSEIYKASIQSIERGRDLHVLYKLLTKEYDIKKSEATIITIVINNRASERINNMKRLSMGITKARWLYANAPCMPNPRRPTELYAEQDTAHKNANGVIYDIREGLLIDGKYIWPGHCIGCKCSSMAILPF